MSDRCTAAIVALLSTVSCAGKSTDTSKPTVSIAWITKGQCDSFFDISRQGAMRAGQNLTAAGGRSATVMILEPTSGCTDAGADAAPVDASSSDSTSALDAVSSGVADAMSGNDASGDAGAFDAGATSAEGGTACSSTDPQSTLMQGAMDSGVAAIAIDVSNPVCQTPTINAAVAAGIKVITWDSDAPDSNRDVYYGTDNVAGTKLAVGVFASLIGGTGKVVLQTSMSRDANGVYHLATSSTYTDRVNTFNQEIAKYSGIQVVATVPCTGTNPQDHFCSQQIEAQLQANPDLKGIFFARGKILRETDLATAAPLFTAGMIQNQTLRAVAFDAPADAVANIKAGYAQFVLNQKLFGWGYDVVTLAYEMVTNNRMPATFEDSGFDTVCPNNIDQFTTLTQTQNYIQPLAKCQYL